MRRGLAALAAWLLPAAAALAATPRVVDYIYIEANEGGSSGGHAAIRFGDQTYHFQHEPGGLLRLRRDVSQHFRYAYGVLENRTMHVRRIAVPDATYDRLRRTFAERYLVDGKRFEARDTARDERALLALLLARRRGATSGTIALRGAGFFVPGGELPEGGIPGGELPDRSRDDAPDIAVPSLALRRRLEASDGPDALRRRIDDTRRALAALAPTTAPLSTPVDSAGPDAVFGYPFATHHRDLLTALVALEVMDRGLPLRRAAAWPTTDADLRLDDDARHALAAFADRLTDELTRLLHSDRPDWGFAFLVGLARLGALDESVRTGRLVLLDAFPPGAEVVEASYLRQHRDALAHLRAEAREEFARVGTRLRAPAPLQEPDFAELEDAGNRMLELDAAGAGPRGLRLWPGTLVPSREGTWSDLVVPDVPTAALERALARAAAAEDELAAGLARDHRYDLVAHNCVSEIFRTVDAAGTPPGRPIEAAWSLDFIPFVSARAVDDAWEVRTRTDLLSTRRARLRAMYEREPPVVAWLRETNVLTSTIYRRNPDDSFFLFFTDDAVVPRPLFGAANVVAGVGAAAAGLALLPVDRGHLLSAGLRGVAFSLPELAFFNIRKGSFDYVAPADRPADDDVAADATDARAGTGAWSAAARSDVPRPAP